MLTRILPNTQLLFPYFASEDVTHLSSSLVEGMNSIFETGGGLFQDAFFSVNEIPTEIAAEKFGTISNNAKPLDTLAGSNNSGQDALKFHEETRYDGVTPEVTSKAKVLMTPTIPAAVAATSLGSGNTSKDNYLDSTLNWFAANHDPLFGMNYWTRGPQNIVSILNNIHKVLPLEAAGSFIGIAGVGGVLDTYVILRRGITTATVLSNSTKIEEEFKESQQTLKNTVASVPSTSHALIDTTKKAWSARAELHKLVEAKRHRNEHMVDGVRYTLGAWTVRTFFAVRMFLHGVTWLARASGILSVVAGGLQMVSGLLKWRSAQQASSIVKKALIELNKLKFFSQNSEVMVDVISHIQNKRENVLHKAREKRLRAKCEAAAGTGTVIFGVVGCFFPPAFLGAVGVGLIYAGFRIYKGTQLYFSNKQQKQQESAWRTEIDNVSPDATKADKVLLMKSNPYYAVRYVVESIHQDQNDIDNPSWLIELLIKLNIPNEDIRALHLMAKNEADMPAACKALESMLFSESWFSQSNQSNQVSA